MSKKATVWILGDQLLQAHPALQKAEADFGKPNVQVLLIESDLRRRKHPYHRQKIVLLFSAMRHYVDSLREDGWQVDYRQSTTFSEAIAAHVEDWQPDAFLTMAAADYNGRSYQKNRLPQLTQLPITQLRNTQFLLGRFNPYPNADPDKRVVMEYFYRAMRKEFGLLMDNGEPAGGAWNFDKQNRQPLPSDNKPPNAPSFAPDAITQQVMDEVETAAFGFGTVEGFDYAVTHAQANAAFGNFISHRLHDFGAYEDAMTQRHDTLYHSVLSPYLNIGLLEPLPLAQAAERAYREGRAPINSVEGFVRQIIGWREFMYWQYWRQMPGMIDKNEWNATRELPNFFWDGQTEMRCLSHAINRALQDGYTHHIERLMLLSNFSMLAGLNPAKVNNWFLIAFVDAYEWVMLPNVIGMGLNADGGLTATKPYISSANYINKMGDYCADCRFNHKQRHGEDACPFNYLYWNFLLEHEETLRANPRLGRNVLGLRHLDEGEQTAVRQQAAQFLADLSSNKQDES